MIIQGLYLWVIWKGGFFNYWGGAQWIYIILQVILLIALVAVIINIDKIKKNAGATKIVESNIIGTLLSFGLFYWGGFFDAFIQFLMK